MKKKINDEYNYIPTIMGFTVLKMEMAIRELFGAHEANQTLERRIDFCRRYLDKEDVDHYLDRGWEVAYKVAEAADKYDGLINAPQEIQDLDKSYRRNEQFVIDEELIAKYKNR